MFQNCDVPKGESGTFYPEVNLNVLFCSQPDNATENLSLRSLLMAFILLLQEATAYFSLVYFFSGICGAAISKKLENMIGRKVCIPTVRKKKLGKGNKL